MEKSEPTAPEHLDAAARAWWESIQREYAITDAGGLALLRAGAEAFQRAEAARAEIDRDGMMVADRFGQKKPHPLLATERDARSQILHALKGLHLDLEPVKKVGKPTGGLGWAPPARR